MQTEQAKTKIEIEGGPFQLIMADPPWRFMNRSQKGEGKNAVNKYQCMTLDEIKALDVASIADPKGCWLWLWTTAPMLRKGFEILDAWGFEFSTELIWEKRTKHGKRAFGTGYIGRNCHEPVLIARRGKPPKLASKSIRSVFDGLLREHSRKPDNAYQIAEQLFGDVTRADLFSRENRLGWSAWGNETGVFNPPQTDVEEFIAHQIYQEQRVAA